MGRDGPDVHATMNRNEAERLLELSREANWAFPTSSSGSILVRPDAGAWVRRLVAERDELGAAARFLVEDGDHDAAAEVAANAWRAWLLAGDVPGGRAFLAAVLDVADATPARERALALYGDGLLAFKQGALADTRARSEAALEIARRLGDPEATTLALLGLSRVAFAEDPERARSLAAKALDAASTLDPSMRQAPLHMYAQGTRLAGELERAAELLADSLELNRRLGDPGMIAVELHNLGHVELRRGNLDAAERHFAECADMGSDDDPYDVAMRDLNQAAIAFARGDRTQAADLLRRSRSTLGENGLDAAPDDAFEIDWLDRQLTTS